MQNNKIYIAGKVTGLNYEDVKEEFNQAAEICASQGFEVVNPLTIINNKNEDWATAMRKCIKALCDCSHIFMISNWEESKGAKLENKIAREIGIICIYETVI